MLKLHDFCNRAAQGLGQGGEQIEPVHAPGQFRQARLLLGQGRDAPAAPGQIAGQIQHVVYLAGAVQLAWFTHGCASDTHPIFMVSQIVILACPGALAMRGAWRLVAGAVRVEWLSMRVTVARRAGRSDG